MFYYVYMLKCTTPGIEKTYVGYTKNVTLRLKLHNSGKGAKSTRGLKWKIIFKKRFNDKSIAMSYEYNLKKDFKKRKKIVSNLL